MQDFFYAFGTQMSNVAKKKIQGYINSFPNNYWKAKVNISSSHQNGMIKISDGIKQHEIYLHECKEDE